MKKRKGVPKPRKPRKSKRREEQVKQELLAPRALEERLAISDRTRRRWTAKGILPVSFVEGKRFDPWDEVCEALLHPAGKGAMRVVVRATSKAGKKAKPRKSAKARRKPKAKEKPKATETKPEEKGKDGQ